VLPRGESSRIEVGNLGNLETVRHYELKRSGPRLPRELVTSLELCGPVVQPIRTQDGFTQFTTCLYEEQIDDDCGGWRRTGRGG
jgi:hypothetical protein